MALKCLFAFSPDQSVVLFDIIPDQFIYSPNALYAINEINLSPEISGCTNIDIVITICMQQLMTAHVVVVLDIWKKCMLIMIQVLLVMRLTYVMNHGMTFLLFQALNEELNSTITEMEFMMSDTDSTISSMTDMVEELTLMNEEMSLI